MSQVLMNTAPTAAGAVRRAPGACAPLTALVLFAVFAIAFFVAFPVAAKVNIPAPSVAAKSYVLMDHATGRMLAEHNADERVEPASITKAMTVYAAGHALASGLISMGDEVLVSEKAWKMGGSRMFIEVNTRVTVEQLLDGIIIQSGNDASVALAEHISGSEEVFASVMNEHARNLGMEDSHFSNATGWPDPETYTTAHDLALLASALIREFPDLYSRFAVKEYTYNEIKQANRNRLLYRDASVDGIKTGHTESAGYCLLTSAERDGMRLIAAVMGTASDTVRTEASHALLNYGYRFFETRKIYAAGDVVTTPRVWGGAVETFPAGPGEAAHLIIPRGRYADMKAVAKLDEPIRAPLAKGQTVGTVEVSLEGESFGEIPLRALEAVPEGSMFSRLIDSVMILFE
ncbi:MAG: D-alanyl-D-alanine carboxypeptidase family protein [Gammaproteobacteria bacterium]